MIKYDLTNMFKKNSQAYREAIVRHRPRNRTIDSNNKNVGFFKSITHNEDNTEYASSPNSVTASTNNLSPTRTKKVTFAEMKQIRLIPNKEEYQDSGLTYELWESKIDSLNRKIELKEKLRMYRLHNNINKIKNNSHLTKILFELAEQDEIEEEVNKLSFS